MTQKNNNDGFKVVVSKVGVLNQMSKINQTVEENIFAKYGDVIPKLTDEQLVKEYAIAIHKHGVKHG